MSLYLVTGRHYLEVEANDREEAVSKYTTTWRLYEIRNFSSEADRGIQEEE